MSRKLKTAAAIVAIGASLFVSATPAGAFQMDRFRGDFGGARGMGRMSEGFGGMRRAGGGFGGAAAMGAGLGVGLLVGAISRAHIEDPSDGTYETCIRCGLFHVHTTNLPGKPPVALVDPPKLRRVNCGGGICKPVRFGNYNLWPYTDDHGGNFAQITDLNGNTVNTGAPGAQINGYTIIP